MRARQRSRTAIPAFSIPLSPQVSQVGVDRMQIGVLGSWRVEPSSPNELGRCSTAADYVTAITNRANLWGWFRKPERRGDSLILRTRANQGSLLKSTRIQFFGIGDGGGNIQISLTCNPTETMAHLLAASMLEGSAPTPDVFLSELGARSPQGFFSRFGVAPSLNHRENWLPNYDLAVRLLGHDPFGTFMPIFFSKLMALMMDVIAPADSDVSTFNDGTSARFQLGQISGELQWGRANVPQIETYIERFHSDAVAAVRSAGQLILSSLDEARVRQHFHRVSFERQVDLFSIRSQLPAEKDLSIYAKSENRLRFEVSRPKRGRYHTAFLAAPIDRLMQIFNSERQDFPDCCDWDSVSSFFAPPDTPWIGDFINLISLVSDVCAENDISLRPVMASLFVDSGGSYWDGKGVPEEVFTQLMALGILERTTLRNREKSGVRRLTLAPHYKEIVRAILESLEKERSESV